MTWLDHVTNAGKFVSDGLDQFKTFAKQYPGIRDSKWGKFIHGDAVGKLVKDSGVAIDNIREIHNVGFKQYHGPSRLFVHSYFSISIEKRCSLLGPNLWLISNPA